MSSMEFDGCFGFLGTSPNLTTEPPVSANVRLMILYDAQPNAVNPVFADILGESDGSAVGFFSCRNVANRLRFRTLVDKIYNISMAGKGDPNVPAKVIHIYKRLPNLRAEFKSSSTPMTQGDITVGAIYVLTFYQFLYPTSGYTSFSYPFLTDTHARIRFLD